MLIECGSRFLQQFNANDLLRLPAQIYTVSGFSVSSVVVLCIPSKEPRPLVGRSSEGPLRNAPGVLDGRGVS
jgi:hypothetical protein